MHILHFWVPDQKLKDDQSPWFWHLVEILEILLLHVLSNDACKCATNLFLISWESFENVNLLYVERWLTPIWLTRMSVKVFQFRFSLDMVNDDWLPPKVLTSGGNLVNSVLYVLCYDECKFATNLFLSISWEPFENVNLLYFLLKMQIWNGCNALYVAGNSIKDINAKLTFLSTGSKVERWLKPHCLTDQDVT